MLVLVLGAAVARAETAGATVNAYYPLAGGMRLQYLTRSSLDNRATLTWSVTHQRTTAGPEAAEVVWVKSLASRWRRGQPVQREEHYLREERGVFTPAEDDAESYGPRYLLPPEDDLVADAVWVYAGLRAIPFAFHLLGLVRNNDLPVPTSGRYHVLDVAPLATPAAEFQAACQVTGIERLTIPVLKPEPEDVLLRCRRFYVKGLGLVREDLEFLDMPRLGALTTELTGWENATPEGVRPAARVAKSTEGS